MLHHRGKRNMFETAGFPRIFKFYVAVTASLALVSLAFTSYYTWVTKTPYPYGLPIFGGLKNFTDLTDFAGRFKNFGMPSFWHHFIPELDANYQKEYPLIYPSPLLTVVALLYSTRSPLTVYIAILAITMIMLTSYLCAGLITRGYSPAKSVIFSLFFILTAWPVAFTFARGNLEGADFFQPA